MMTIISNATSSQPEFVQMEAPSDEEESNEMKLSLSDLDNLMLDWIPEDRESGLISEGSMDGLFLDGLEETGMKLENLTDLSLYGDLLPVDNMKSSYNIFDLGDVKVKEEVNDWTSDGGNTQSIRNELLLINANSRISKACCSLGITNDPHRWRMDEVKKWCRWVLAQSNLSSANFLVDSINIDGNTLCQLSHDEFQKMAPQVGESIYVELELWKNVCLLSPLNDWPPNTTQSVSNYGTSFTNLDSGVTTHTSSTGMTSVYSTNVRPSSLPLQTYFISTSNCNALNSLYFSGTSDPVLPQTSSFLMSSPLGNVQHCPGYSPSSNSSFGDYNSNSTPSSHNSIESYESLVNEEHGFSEVISPTMHQSKQGNHLWQFLKELLLQPYMYQNCIRWLDRTKGIFKIEDSVRVAKLWGQRKNRPAMNYDKLSRSIRQYYKKGIIKKTSQSKRLVYQFCPQYV